MYSCLIHSLTMKEAVVFQFKDTATFYQDVEILVHDGILSKIDGMAATGFMIGGITHAVLNHKTVFEVTKL